MSLFRATTGWRARRFARRQYTRDTRVQLACRRQRLHAHEHASAPLSLYAPAVDCPRNDDRAADGGAFMYLH